MLFSAVIFDFDGVLANTEELGLRVELEALSRIGLNYSREEYIRRFMGLSDVQIREIYAAEHLHRLGRELPSDFVSNVKALKHKAFDEKICPIPGVIALLHGLDAPKAVASSSRAAQLNHKMERIGLHSLFDPHIYSTQLVGRSKPAPDIYLYAAQKLGSDPKRCLVIEDSPNGIRAAVAAGMTVWGFLGGGHMSPHHDDLLRSAGAQKTFTSYEEIRLDLLPRQNAS